MADFGQIMEQGALYARLDQRQDRLQFALDGIHAMRAIAPHAYASISFGKQSICLAHMLYQIEPSMPMFFLASWESFMLYDYESVIDSFTRRWPINLTIVRADNVTGNTLTWKQTRDMGQYDLQNMCNRRDWDGWYWGLSKEESQGRRCTLSVRWDGQVHPTVFRYADQKYRCCPLMNWTLLDIAAYVQEHDIPLLDIYRKYGLGVRTTARLTRNAAELGGVALLKHMATERLNRIAARFPELRGYT